MTERASAGGTPGRKLAAVAAAVTIALALTALPAGAWAGPAGSPASVPATAASPGAPGSQPATATAPAYVPPLWSVLPFVLLLLAMAILPLVGPAQRFWHRNRNKLLVALVVSAPVLLFYLLLHPAMTVVEAGAPRQFAAGAGVLKHVLAGAVLHEYVPFIVLLFSLYTISGGIRLSGDLPAHPLTNTALLGLGTVLASFIGTTGAAMLLIRPLLQTNSERRHTRHTVIFFIFLVCNIGGCLLPIGDPPLFLGYLRGVPFLWPLHLALPWAIASGLTLLVYYCWDAAAYRKERPADIVRDETVRQPFRLHGRLNLLYLAAVVMAVAMIVPGKPLPLLPSVQALDYMREAAMLALVGLSLLTTPRGIRQANHFTFAPIAEVAALFLGIFITMQAPVEILRACGPSLGLTQPWQFFWATGGLSSFLDNAPTYVIFFETASALPPEPGQAMLSLLGGQVIRVDLLTAVSLGAVFMGANTYIGNGPNFMVKAIAEERGIRMPSFFGYMLYSAVILLPLFLLLSLVFFVFRLL